MNSYMSQLNSKDRNFLLKLAYSDDPPTSHSVPLRKPAELQPSERENRGNDCVERLKRELVEERGEVFRLRQECEGLRMKVKEEKDAGEKLVREQEDRISLLSDRFKEVMSENLKLKKQITFSLKQYEEHNAEASSATEALTTLRQLLLGMLDKENSRKKRDISEKRMWESLGVLIPESEPPVDFPVFTTESEIGKSAKTDVEIRKKDETIKALRTKIDQLEAENTQLLGQKRDYKRNSDLEIEKLKRQLVGSVRRVQYLVQEKDQIAGEKKQLQDYCSKLEAKLLGFTSTGGRKTNKSASYLTEESQAVDLRVDRQKLMEMVESENGEVSEEVLRRVQEASCGK